MCAKRWPAPAWKKPAPRDLRRRGPLRREVGYDTGQDIARREVPRLVMPPFYPKPHSRTHPGTRRALHDDDHLNT
jgi:hypothetical protein